jgi:large subunit ribosomal protein L10
MALSRVRKQELIESYGDGLARSVHAFLLSYRGVSVPQVTELRSRVRQKGGQYQVVKNTLALRAIEGGALATLQPFFTGPTAVVYGEDPVVLAKVLTDYVKEVPAFEFKAALVDGRAVAAADIKELAQLPSRDELIAKLLFLLQSPIVRLARVLAAVPQQFVVVMDQVRQQKEQSA